MLNIICEICEEHIATAKKKDLSVPLTGHMFGPPLPDRMVHSLLADVEWEYIRCPMCNKRPFIRDDEVMTPYGTYRIPLPTERGVIPSKPFSKDDIRTVASIAVTEDGFEPVKYLCECCDPPREFDKKAQLSGHKGAMQREANKNG